MRNILSHIEDPQFELGHNCVSFVCSNYSLKEVKKILGFDFIEYTPGFAEELEKKMKELKAEDGLWISKKFFLSK